MTDYTCPSGQAAGPARIPPPEVGEHRPSQPTSVPPDSVETLEVEFADMAADQQCRGDALTAAIRHLAATGELPDATQHQPRTVLGLADVYADYIRDGSRP